MHYWRTGPQSDVIAGEHIALSSHVSGHQLSDRTRLNRTLMTVWRQGAEGPVQLVRTAGGVAPAPSKSFRARFRSFVLPDGPNSASTSRQALRRIAITWPGLHLIVSDLQNELAAGIEYLIRRTSR